MFVRLGVDAAGVKKGTDEASRHLGGIEKVAKRVGVALAGVFAAREIIQFGKASITAFAEAEAGWNRLAATVDATGASFTALRPRIEAAANAMMDASRFGDDEFAAALQGLTIQTGNVEKSLGLMGLAADLAAAKQLSLESASETLGRAFAGNTTQLTRMFPALKDSADLFGDLQKIVAGMAEKDVQGLEGQLVQMNNAWGEFKEEIGAALTAAVDGPSIIDRVTESIKDLTNWISDHQGEIKTFAETLLTIASTIGVVVRSLGKPFGEMLAFGKPAGDMSGFSGGAGGTWGGGSTTPAVAAAAARVAADERMADSAKAAADALDALHRRLGITAGDNRIAGPALVGMRSERDIFRSGLGGLPNTSVGPGRAGSAPQIGMPKETGFLGQMFGGLKTQVMGLASAFGPLAAAVAIFKPVLEGLMSALGPALTALAIPLKNFGHLIGSVIAPILEAFAPVLRVVTIAFSYVIEGIGTLIRGIGNLLNKLPGSIGNPLKEFGQNMIDAAKKTREATKAQVDLTKSAEELASSMTNVPRVLALALLRFRASTAGTPGTGGPGTGSIPDAPGPWVPPPPGHPTMPPMVFNGPMTFNGVGDMEGVIKAVEGHVMKAGWRAGTSRLAPALG